MTPLPWRYEPGTDPKDRGCIRGANGELVADFVREDDAKAVVELLRLLRLVCDAEITVEHGMEEKK